MLPKVGALKKNVLGPESYFLSIFFGFLSFYFFCIFVAFVSVGVQIAPFWCL
jgi:hypothetical protein